MQWWVVLKERLVRNSCEAWNDLTYVCGLTSHLGYDVICTFIRVEQLCYNAKNS